jgi:hypothetical protein
VAGDWLLRRFATFYYGAFEMKWSDEKMRRQAHHNQPPATSH